MLTGPMEGCKLQQPPDDLRAALIAADGVLPRFLPVPRQRFYAFIPLSFFFFHVSNILKSYSLLLLAPVVSPGEGPSVPGASQSYLVLCYIFIHEKGYINKA